MLFFHLMEQSLECFYTCIGTDCVGLKATFRWFTSVSHLLVLGL